MGQRGDVQATGAASLGQPHAFDRHWFDVAAVALLGLGCLTGTVTSGAESMLRQRVRELELRLLERVPAAIEQKYRDY